jgi:hypothetical protein
MTTARKVIDWENIEKHYRAGATTLRGIGIEYGVTEGAIRKKAKAEGWERDLSAKVAEKVRNDLVRKEVRSEQRLRTKHTEKEVIDAAATAVVNIVVAHRTDIGKARATANRLLEELQQVSSGDIQALIQQASKALAEQTEDAALDGLVRKAMSLGSRASTMNSLANALKVVISLEREAFNIQSATEQQQDSYEDRLKALGQ